MRYQRFRLQISSGRTSGSYRVNAQSARGEGQGSFIPPFLAGQASELHQPLSRRTRHLRPAGGRTAEPPEAIGERLFTALFPEEIRRLYERCLDRLDTDPDSGLRLELSFDPRDPSLTAFQELPWELLRRPDTGEFLALSRRKPMVRYFAVPQAPGGSPPPTTLRILAVGAQPRHGGFGPLGLQRELANLRQAVANTGIEVVTPPTPTLGGIRQALLQQTCHVLHFMGHGGSWPGVTGRVLFLETEDGHPDPVRGGDLLNKLADFPSVRLAVLNACDSAASGSSPGAAFDPFSGVASALVLAGMPAVVAMQVPISDQAAIAFSHAFYQRLAAGDPVDAAVAEGRQAVHSANHAGFEWSTPVLFLRAADTDPEPPIPPPQQSTGRWKSVLALLTVVAICLFILSRLLPVPGQRPAVESDPSAQPTSVDSTPVQTVSPQPMPTPQPPSEATSTTGSVGGTAPPATTPEPKPTPESPFEITLQDGEQKTILSDQASIAVQFNSIGQEDFVTVTINGTPEPVLGAGARLSFTARGKRYSAYVLRINPAVKSVALRIARAPHNP